MKSNISKFIVGIILTLYPVYEKIAWFHIFHKYVDLPHLEKVAKYHAECLVIFEERLASFFFSLGLVIFATIILFFVKAKKSIGLNILKYLFILLNVLTGSLILFEMM